MPRRRRGSKLRVRTDEVVRMFAVGDGVEPMFNGEPVFDNAFLARAAWEMYRVATWRWWGTARVPIWANVAPGGAVVYDGFGEFVFDLEPHFTAEEADAALAADLEALERFRGERPDLADAIADGLMTYELALRAHVLRQHT